MSKILRPLTSTRTQGDIGEVYLVDAEDSRRDELVRLLALGGIFGEDVAHGPLVDSVVARDVHEGRPEAALGDVALEHPVHRYRCRRTTIVTFFAGEVRVLEPAFDMPVAVDDRVVRAPFASCVVLARLRRRMHVCCRFRNRLDGRASYELPILIRSLAI